MKTIEELLKNLARPEVLEFGLVTNRLPSVNIGGKFEPVDDEAPTNERLMAMLVTMGGSRYVDSLSDKPVQWTTKLEGVGVIAVAAILRKDIVQARFTVAKREGGPPSVPQRPAVAAPPAPSVATQPQGQKPPVPPAPGSGGAAKPAAPSARSIPAVPPTPQPTPVKPSGAGPAARPVGPTSTQMTAAKATQQLPPQAMKGVGAPSATTRAAPPASTTTAAAPPVPSPPAPAVAPVVAAPPPPPPPVAAAVAAPPPPPPDDEWDDDDEPTLQTLSPPVAPPPIMTETPRAKPARRPEEVAAEEQQRVAGEKAAAEKAAADKAAADKAAADKAAAAKAASEKAAAEKAAAEKAAAEKAAAEKAAAEKAAAEKAAAEKAAAEKAAAEKAAAEKAAAEKAAAEKAAAEKAAAEKAAAEKAAAEKAAAEKAAAEKAAAEKAARERAEQERLARERAEQERLAHERAEEERLAHERAEEERLAHERAEEERLAHERAEAEAAAEAERVAHERAEQERLAQELAEQERLAAEAAAARAAEEEAAAEAAAAEAVAELAARRAAAAAAAGRRSPTPTSLEALDVEITTTQGGTAKNVVDEDADGTEDTVSLPGGVDVARASQQAEAQARARGPVPTTTAPNIPEKDRPKVESSAAIDSFLAMAVAARATDLIIVAGRPVLLRVATDLLPRTQTVAAEQVERIAKEIVPSRLRDTLEKEGSCDFAVEHLTHGRFRVNVSRQRTGVKLTLRVVPKEMPTLASLGLPEVIANGIRHDSGFVVVSGPAGNGKSSTVAALVDLINRESAKHVATIEEPIEHVHPRKMGLVSQRDVGLHTRTKAKAFHSALRSDPDVIVISELRDAESVRQALSAAEGGRLVLGTINAPGVSIAVERMLRLFGKNDEHWARATLASTLRLVVGQHLVPSADRTRLHAAVEVVPSSVALWSAIRAGRVPDATALKAKSRGVVLLDESLADLVRAQKVTLEVARQYAEAPADLEARVARRR